MLKALKSALASGASITVLSELRIAEISYDICTTLQKVVPDGPSQ